MMLISILKHRKELIVKNIINLICNIISFSIYNCVSNPQNLNQRTIDKIKNIFQYLHINIIKYQFPLRPNKGFFVI